MRLARFCWLLVMLAGCDGDNEPATAAGTFPCDAAFCAAGEEVCVYDEDGIITEGQDERVCVSSDVFGGCTACDCLEECYSCQETEVGAYCLIFSDTSQ